ncbi:MAG: acetyltransferase [Acidimicrobiales bacterium]|nr:acetyltransferase [Acidimicrobiales bacterium]
MDSRSSVAIIGAGGHGYVVATTLTAAGHDVVAFYDDDETRWGQQVLGIPIRGPISGLTRETCDKAIVGIGDNRTRKEIVETMDLDWMTVVHPFAWVSPDVELGPGTVVCAGAIVQTRAEIGAHVILNTKASADHDTIVGDFVHMAVCHLAGSASVGEGAFLALSSTVLPGVHVGAWGTVGAGATATKDVAPGTTVVGTPARPLAMSSS